MMLQKEDWEMQIKGELTEAAFPKAKINENIPSHINKPKENLKWRSKYSCLPWSTKNIDDPMYN